MHAISFLSRWLADFTVVGHRSRATALMKAVQALLLCGKLTLTHLGRHRCGAAHVKHQIKAIDRLLGNRHLHAERDGIYRAIAATLLGSNRNPVVIVDWSDCEVGRQWVMLKAAVPVGGRAVTIYEQVFPFKRYNSPAAHREFLRALKRVIPESCRPIVITDAGFRVPWFREVEAQGWHWVGRIRSGIKYFNESSGRWCATDSLYRQATPTTRHLAQVMLSRRKQYHARLYLVRAYQPRRGRPPKRSRSRRYRKLHRAPWLLATSLPHERFSCRKIKRLYAQRMQIEETFRDVKNHRWGMSLRYARSRDGKRLEVLLLIAALATLLQWVFGVLARQYGLARHFQANTERRRSVLSLVFLGQQMLQRLNEFLSDKVLDDAFRAFKCLLTRARPA
jgi:hypothetical protein